MQQLFSPQGTPAIDRELFEDQDCGVEWKQLVYALCVFHAVTNGRKAFGTSGWRVPYGFSVADLQVSTLRVPVISRFVEVTIGSLGGGGGLGYRNIY